MLHLNLLCICLGGGGGGGWWQVNIFFTLLETKFYKIFAINDYKTNMLNEQAQGKRRENFDEGCSFEGIFPPPQKTFKIFQ